MVMTEHPPKSLEEAVYQSIGAASVCWESMEGTGVFDSVGAKKIGDELIAFILDRFTPVAHGAHKWPVDDSCLWSEWKSATGLPNPTQYRNCIHPECNKVEYRDAPKG